MSKSDVHTGRHGLREVARGRHHRLARHRRPSAKVSSGEWHTLGLKAQGARFSVSFDGRLLFTAEDRTFTGLGKVALWTKADSVTRLDRLAIKPLQ